MIETLIGLSSPIVALAICLINNSQQNKRVSLENEKRAIEAANIHEQSMIRLEASLSQKISVIECKMDDLSTRVDKHNNVIERTYALEKDMSVQKEKINVANHRIDDLEGGKND